MPGCVCMMVLSGPAEIREEFHRRSGLVAQPRLLCVSCGARTPILQGCAQNLTIHCTAHLGA